MDVKPRVLVACEESGAVTHELLRVGCNAWSCDILPTSGKHPERHLSVDVLELLKMDWDCVLAFPPCTHLAVSGARHFEQKQRNGLQQMGIGFFLQFTALDNVPYVAIENPVGIMSSVYRKPDQIIQPWQFGHPESKSTCLWVKGLPLLKPTNDVSKAMETMDAKETQRIHYMPPSNERAKMRSKTYPGIAKAIGQQWGGVPHCRIKPMRWQT